MYRLLPLMFVAAAFVSCSKNPQTQLSDTTASTMNDTQRIAHNDTAAHENPPFDSTHVTIHTLPSGVHPFVESHFPGYAIVAASYDPLCGGGPAIDVAIRKRTSPTYSLIFKPDGTFVQKEEDVPISVAPAEVMTQLKKEYAGFKSGKQIERLTLADNSVEYSMDLSKGKLQKEVIFTAGGAVVCEGSE